MSNVYQSVSRYNAVAPKPAFNPLYDARSGSTGPQSYIRLAWIPIIFSVMIFYLKMNKREVIDVPKNATIADKIRNNKIIFNEKMDSIGELGLPNDPHVYNNFDENGLPRSDVSLEKSPALMAENAAKRERFKRNKPILNAVLNGIDSMSNKLVFAGSFANKENAEKVLTRLKSIGYDKAEIIMKEKLPYKIVVTGLNNHPDNSAKAEVRSLQKRGIDVYAAAKNLQEIYRQSQK